MLIYNADYDTLKTKYGFHKGYRKASENKYYVGVNEDDCIQVYENGYMKVGNIVFTEQKELYCHYDANVLRDMFLDGVLKYMKKPTTETIRNNDENDHSQLKVEDVNQKELISHDTAKEIMKEIKQDCFVHETQSYDGSGWYNYNSKNSYAGDYKRNIDTLDIYISQQEVNDIKTQRESKLLDLFKLFLSEFSINNSDDGDSIVANSSEAFALLNKIEKEIDETK